MVCLQMHTGFWRVLWEMLSDIKAVARGEERAAFSIALWLAFFNQAMASSAIINYAPQLLRESGIQTETAATLLTSTVTAAKVCSQGILRELPEEIPKHFLGLRCHHQMCHWGAILPKH